MPETPKSTFRFDGDTRKAIADLLIMKYGRDKTEVVARAIVGMRDIVAGGGEIPVSTPDWSQGRNTIERAQMIIDQKPADEVKDAPFHPMCKHCGQVFGAWNRNASLCSDCKTTRHVGDPRDCPVCTAGSAI
jgi:hypothetical protein